jgi:hypothetical protein
VRIALGILASWGRLKNPGFGAGREVARKVTCRWIYGCLLHGQLIVREVDLRNLFFKVRRDGLGDW